MGESGYTYPPGVQILESSRYATPGPRDGVDCAVCGDHTILEWETFDVPALDVDDGQPTHRELHICGRCLRLIRPRE